MNAVPKHFVVFVPFSGYWQLSLNRFALHWSQISVALGFSVVVS